MKVFGIAAMFTGSGKTSVTSAILSHLENSIQIKVGPDFIDPIMESFITGKHGYNLDKWIQGNLSENIISVASKKANYAVVEGVMGLYDSGIGPSYSTMAYFKKLKIPYILVVDVSKSAESIYFASKGFITKNCMGVILNKYYGEKHLKMVQKAFLKHRVPIIGTVPFDPELTIGERHLGLNSSTSEERMKVIANNISKYIDFSFLSHVPEIYGNNSYEIPRERSNKTVYVARDAAFSFYYETSLDFLSEKYNLKFFSPLKDEVPTNADFIYLGGGYPELYGEELSNAINLKSYLRDYVENNGKVYSECGGTMFLMENMESNGENYEMTGIFKGKTWMEKRPVLNYTKLLADETNPYFKKGQIIYGHEFHYGRIETTEKTSLVALRGNGIEGRDGIVKNNALGMYTHIDLMRYGDRMKI
jgi:cobyrinic acid a,c-diamide synthase